MTCLEKLARENIVAYFAQPQLKGKTQCENTTELFVIITYSAAK
jgi:hypothetical protein